MAPTMPQATAETRPFWEGCAAHELRYQRCAQCGHVQAIPRALCAHCHATSLAWQRASGRGRVLSVTTVRRAPTPAFATPYAIALLDMEEGFRLMANVRGTHELAIGAPVRIVFRDVDGGALPEAEALSEMEALR